MKLTEAAVVFEDNLDDIIDAMSENLTLDMEEEKKASEILGTSWVADEVRKIRSANLFDDRTKRLRYLVNHKVALNNPAPARITETDKERAREVPIESMYTGKLKKSAGRKYGICQFHKEKTGSLCIYPTNTFKCYGCDAHGDSITFYMKMHNVSFIKAVRSLI